MREIKFRFWDKINNKMYPDMGRLFTQGINEWFSKASSSDIIPMQFTGLKDKNGKEIFEGDFCKDNDGIIEMPVALIEGVFCFDPKPYLALREYEYLEVIGNIYENPTLTETPGQSTREGASS